MPPKPLLRASFPRWAAESHLDCPGNSRDRLGQPRRQQKAIWIAQEAAEDYLDSPGGSREPFERQLKGLGTLNGVNLATGTVAYRVYPP